MKNRSNVKPENLKVKVFKTVRYTESEFDRIKEQSQIAGVTPCKFIRETSLRRHVKSAVDRTLLQELRRLGGLCKHAITKTDDPNNKKNIDAAFRTLQTFSALLIDTMKDSEEEV